MAPGAHPPIDLIPVLKYLPEKWGASWKGICREVKKMQRELYFGLLQEVEDVIKEKEDSGTGAFIEEVLKRREEFGLTREMIG